MKRLPITDAITDGTIFSALLRRLDRYRPMQLNAKVRTPTGRVGTVQPAPFPMPNHSLLLFADGHQWWILAEILTPVPEETKLTPWALKPKRRRRTRKPKQRKAA